MEISRKGLLRHVVSISTWFKQPAFGMQDFEILSRASAFCVSRNREVFPKRLHLITSAHVTSPWLYERYFKDVWSWLQHVNESHTRMTVEFREVETGQILLEVPLTRKVFTHPSRDLAVVHFEDEVELTRQLSASGSPLQPLTLDLLPVKHEEIVQCVGHEISESGSDPESQQDTRVQIPKEMSGQIAAFTDHQLFIRTDKPMGWGMCGGPIIRDSGAIGVVEGVVNPQPDKHEAVQYIEGTASCIRSGELLAFLDIVERYSLGIDVAKKD